MAKKNTVLTTDELADEALANARSDRQQAQEMLASLKDIFSDINNEENMSKAMVLGDKAVDLLDQLSRSNEQIIRLAQIKEKEASRNKVEDDAPIDISVLLREVETRQLSPGSDYSVEETIISCENDTAKKS